MNSKIKLIYYFICVCIHTCIDTFIEFTVSLSLFFYLIELGLDKKISLYVSVISVFIIHLYIKYNHKILKFYEKDDEL